MQIVHKNEDEGGDNRKTYSVGIVICIEGISRYMERVCLGEFRGRNIRICDSRRVICDSRRVFGRSKEEVWRRR